jgi:hypothetical protein
MYRILACLLAASALIGCGERPTSQDPLATPSRTSAPPPTVVLEEANEPVATNVTAELTTEQTDFGNEWKASSTEERRRMADLAKVYPLFQGATKPQIKAALGVPSGAGIDRFGDDVMRYELGDVPGADGGGKYHLTFVFKDDVVVTVMGNFISISP